MAKVKDYSARLVDLAANENFKVFLGNLEDDTVVLAGCADRYFDKYGSAKVILVNKKSSVSERRVGIAQALEIYKRDYKAADEDFFISIEKKDLDAELALGSLVNEDLFRSNFEKLQKKMSYNEAVQVSAKQFGIQSSLASKLVRKK